MVRKKRKYTVKTKSRTVIISLLFAFIIFTLIYTIFSDLQKITILNIEKKELLETSKKLKDEEASLESDIERLSDDLYVARYAREKYFYSKEGELVLKIDGE